MTGANRSAYTESNDTAPSGPGLTSCDRPCGTTSLPTVDGALHGQRGRLLTIFLAGLRSQTVGACGPGTPLPNGTRLDDSWATIVPKSKLVLALGWFHQQWLANQTTSKWPWSGPYELGRRISFCQASRTIMSGLRPSQECQQ